MANPTRSGSVEKVPCPSCGKDNDYRRQNEQHLLDTQSVMSCDHCKRPMEIVAIRQVLVVTVRQAAPGARATSRGGLPPARRPTTISHGQLKKLLGR